MKPIAIALILVAVLVLVGAWFWQSQQAAAPSAAAKPAAGGAPAPAPAPAPAAGPTPWRCASLAGTDSNILRRQPDHSLECATMDGKNCYWYGSMAACNAAFPSVNKDANTPLNCAGNHITLYGDGRTNPAHWCYNGRTDI